MIAILEACRRTPVGRIDRAARTDGDRGGAHHQPIGGWPGSARRPDHGVTGPRRLGSVTLTGRFAATYARPARRRYPERGEIPRGRATVTPNHTVRGSQTR